MTAPHADQLIDGYFARIRAAAGDLPAGAPQQMLDDIRSHIVEARSREPEESDASILNILDRLGDPDLLVEETRNRTATGQTVSSASAGSYRRGILEIAALVLLPFLWPVGVTLLWISPALEIIGTSLPPGGYPGLLLLALSHTVVVRGSDGFSVWQVLAIIVLSALFYTLPVITAGYLAIHLHWGRPRQAAATA